MDASIRPALELELHVFNDYIKVGTRRHTRAPHFHLQSKLR